ncbi:hypothetical protein GALL_399770 [mine drainage metagenome]|uniref:Uncharacterized protein n=1 Tax=mine drainage metagenome TaxID=410659 RepID=A0A1J5Q4X6_9ZZZZ
MPVPMFTVNQFGVNWRTSSMGEGRRVSGFQVDMAGLQKRRGSERRN